MDPLSSAATVFAVVSLAIQLGESATKIHRLLREINHAPEELTRLIRLLENLEGLLRSIGQFIQEQSEYSTLPAPPAAAHQSMELCNQKLVEFGTMVDKFKCARASHCVKKSLASTRLALKRHHIRELEGHLKDTLQTLHVAMSLNASHLQ